MLRIEPFDKAVIKIRKLAIDLTKLALGVIVTGTILLLLLANIYPPYIPHTSIAVSIALYLITGLLLGIETTMSYIVGKDWHKIAKLLDKNGEHDEHK